MKSISFNDRLNELKDGKRGNKWIILNFLNLRIEQTMVNGGTVFQDREFRRNILGVGKDKVLFCFVLF